MNRNDIHRQVIEHFGIPAQLEKMSEELRELDEELWRWMDKEDNKLELLGEFADVLNMCEQFKIIAAEILKIFTLDEVESAQNFKMFRTKGVIENK